MDISKLGQKDTIRELAEKSGIMEEELKKVGLDPEDKIGTRKSTITQVYRGKSKGNPPTPEEVSKLEELGISLEKKERNVTQEFIEKLEKLQGIGVDISKLGQKDTIRKLAEKSGIMEEELKKVGLDPEDTIGQSKTRIALVYRGNGRGNLPTPEEVSKLEGLGISLEERNVTQEFIEKLEKLQGLGVDISKLGQKDTIRELAEKSGIMEEELKKVGLDPEDKIGTRKSTITQVYRGKSKGKLPTPEEVRKLEELGISLESRKKTSKEIGQATCDATVEKCDEAQTVLSNLLEKQKEGGIEQSE